MFTTTGKSAIPVLHLLYFLSLRIPCHIPAHVTLIALYLPFFAITDLDAGADAPAVSDERTGSSSILISVCKFQHSIQVDDRSLKSVTSFKSAGETDAKSVSRNDGKSFKQRLKHEQQNQSQQYFSQFSLMNTSTTVRDILVRNLKGRKNTDNV